MTTPPSAWNRTASWLLALPLVGLTAVGTYLGVEYARPGTLTAPRPRTVPEAVAAGNPAQVLEMMAQGADLNAPAHVRAGLLDEREHDLTPIEAAILARRPELLALLLRSGADPLRAPAAPCLAGTYLPEALPLLAGTGGQPGPVTGDFAARLARCGAPTP